MNDLLSKLLGSFDEGSNLLLAVASLVIFGAFVHVWLAFGE